MGGGLLELDALDSCSYVFFMFHNFLVIFLVFSMILLHFAEFGTILIIFHNVMICMTFRTVV